MTSRSRTLACVTFVVRRAMTALPMLVLAILIAFTLTRLIPGDPVTMMMDGRNADPEFLRRLRDAGSIDQPFWRQFADYMADLVHGNLGRSWRYGGMPVATLIGDALPITLLLVSATVVVAVPVGIAAGLASAHRSGTWLDGLITAGSVLALAMPPVVLATWLMMVVSTFWDPSGIGEFAGIADFVAPVLALAVAPIGLIARVTRTQILEVLGQDYVRCARAKGLSEPAVLLRHALPNSLVAVSVVVGTMVGTVLTSTAVVETVFNLPGLGQLAILSVLARDYPLAGAIILTFVLAQVGISLAIDLFIITIDPRSRDPMVRS